MQANNGPLISPHTGLFFHLTAQPGIHLSSFSIRGSLQSLNLQAFKKQLSGKSSNWDSKSSVRLKPRRVFRLVPRYAHHQMTGSPAALQSSMSLSYTQIVGLKDKCPSL